MLPVQRSNRVSCSARSVLAAGLCAAVALVMPVRGTGDSARLPDPTYPEILRLAESGQATRALAELDRRIAQDARAGGPAIEGLVLRAALLGALGRHGEAVGAWNDVANREPALAPRARRKAAEAALASGDPDLVRRQVGQPARSGPSRANHDLLIAAAAVHRERGQPEQAADLAERIVGIERRGPLADAARLEVAAAREAAGRRADAIAVLRDAQRNFRTPAAFVRAREEERRLTATPARFTETDYRAMAARLTGAARFAEGLEVLRVWRDAYPTSPSLDRIDADIVDALYRMRANDEAREHIAAFVRRHPTSSRLGHVRVVQFRLDVREGRTENVRSLGGALFSGGAGRLTASQRRSVGSLLAAYLVSIGEVDEGLAAYRDLFRITSGRAAQIDVLWRAGVAAYRAGQYERAETNLRAALGRRPGPDTTEVVTYWLAAAEEKIGKTTAAVARLTDLARRVPWSYYGLRASARLAALGVRAPAPDAPVFPDLELDAGTLRHPEFRAASVLARAGLRQDAAAAARALARAARTDRAATLLAVRASHLSGDFRAGLGLLASSLGRYLEGPATGAPEDLRGLIYPKAFWAEVQPVADAQHVDPLLMLAIMRRESRFDPGARSSAGATGLFQIMSYTAEEIAPEAGIDEPDERGLSHAATNTALAVTLVRKLLDLFGNDPIPVVAAYNAGEDRAGAWWQAARDIPEDLFVDTIPYSETRAYVREVYVNYEMYRRLYGR